MEEPARRQHLLITVKGEYKINSNLKNNWLIINIKQNWMSSNFDDMPIGTKHHHNASDPNNFDDVPISSTHNKFVLSEYA